MSFTNFLKEQLNDFVDSYKKYLRLTYGFTLTLTILCFLIAAVLFRVSSYQDSQSARGISILSYFFQRYSQNNVYSLVDLVKTIFILIVCLFSVALVNGQKNNLNPKDYSLRYFLDSISLKSVITLTAIFAVVSILDVGLFI